jgi:hypothetical protein
LSATSPDTGPPTRVVSTVAAPDATATPSSGAPTRRLGLALAVIATAQLMVVLDGTIVNVALPHVQRALGFSDSNLEWVVNVYALVFGGLLLLGGRSGDLLGRRRIFIAGILVFAGASLLGGFATDQAWLLSARALQGVGGAMAAPTALSLIAVTFPEGLLEARDRAGRYFRLEDCLDTLRRTDLQAAADELLDRLLAHTGRRPDDDVAVLLFEAASPPARPEDEPATAPVPAGDTLPDGDPPAAAASGFLGRPAARKR